MYIVDERILQFIYGMLDNFKSFWIVLFLLFSLCKIGNIMLMLIKVVLLFFIFISVFLVLLGEIKYFIENWVYLLFKFLILFVYKSYFFFFVIFIGIILYFFLFIFCMIDFVEIIDILCFVEIFLNKIVIFNLVIINIIFKNMFFVNLYYLLGR